jgi:hypothetical protein
MRMPSMPLRKRRASPATHSLEAKLDRVHRPPPQTAEAAGGLDEDQSGSDDTATYEAAASRPKSARQGRTPAKAKVEKGSERILIIIGVIAAAIIILLLVFFLFLKPAPSGRIPKAPGKADRLALRWRRSSRIDCGTGYRRLQTRRSLGEIRILQLPSAIASRTGIG